MSCERFIAQSFAVRTAAHIHHLVASSYAEHIALDEFYTQLLDLTDEYAEMYLATAPGTPSFPSAVPPKGTAAGVLTSYLEDVRAEMAAEKESQAKMNTLAEIEALTLRTLYKLKRLS